MKSLNTAQRQALREMNQLLDAGVPDDSELMLAAATRFVEASPDFGPERSIDVTALFAGAGDSAVGRPIDVPVSLKSADAATFLTGYRQAIEREVGERRAQVKQIADTIIGVAKAALIAGAA